MATTARETFLLEQYYTRPELDDYVRAYISAAKYYETDKAAQIVYLGARVPELMFNHRYHLKAARTARFAGNAYYFMAIAAEYRDAVICAKIAQVLIDRDKA